MKNEFVLAFNEVLEEKQLPREIILKALESAMVSAYRRAVNASNAQLVEATIDPETGHVSIYAEKEVVEEVQDERTEVTLENARKVNPEAELETMVLVETTPKDFGRVAAQTARQVIQQRIREAERSAQMVYFEKQLGEIVSGVIQATNAQGITVGLDMKAEGIMLRKEMIPGERFHMHDRLRALIFEVKDGPRGPQIMLSRAHRNFLRRLLENEVPEIYHGVVEIRSIAREPGERAKVAVVATQQGIDPVGACVGIKGVRIQAIVRELHDEKIDVIEWNADPALYIAKAISPARVSGVYLNDMDTTTGNKTATVVVPEDMLSLAIGRDGQNARLAAKLTGWRIDIKSLPEAAHDTLEKLRQDPTLAPIAAADPGIVEQVEASLQKKAEGRPLSPEEYEVITRFVDRIERRSATRRQAEKIVEEARLREARAGIPEAAFSQSILDGGLLEHVAILLQEAGYETVGDVAMQMRKNPDAILALQGVGPKAMQEIQKLVDSLQTPVQAEVEAVQPEVVPQPELPAVEIPQEAVAPELTAAGELPVSEVPGETASAEAAASAGEVTPDLAATPEAEVTMASLDDFFNLKPEELVPTELLEEEDDSDKKDKKKKKKGHRVEIEYDPDRDTTLVHKKHKRGDGDFGWEQ
jgi:N utilization substance protein A